MNLAKNVNTTSLKQTSELDEQLGMAWAAGFVDGEGCIHIIRQKYGANNRVSYRLRMHIAQNNYEVLVALRAYIGEHANIIPIKRTHSVNKQVYTLNFDGKHAYKAVMKLKPYLIRKQCEAQAANNFWIEGRVEERTGRNPVAPELMEIRNRWYKKMQKLK
jgi:LAGLIDADG DNA endonuclease family protein